MATRSPLRRLGVFVLFFALVATACGSTATETEAAAPGEEAAPTAEASPLSGQFDTITGESIDLSTLEGQPVVMWFWAPW